MKAEKFRSFIDVIDLRETVRRSETMYLMPSPGLLSGISHVLNLRGFQVLYNDSGSAEVDDNCATASDWAAVGQDIAGALSEAGEAEAETFPIIKGSTNSTAGR